MAVEVLTGAEEARWDLTHLYQSHQDPRIESDLEWSLAEARALREAHLGRVAALDGAAMRDALVRIGELQDRLQRLAGYAFLDFSCDTGDPARGALLQRIEEHVNAVETEMLFFRLEWTQLEDAEADRLLATPELQPYRHYLESARRYRAHVLTEPEERILQEKSTTSRNAWTRLFTENTSALKCLIDGEEVGFEETLSRLHDADRDRRRAAAAAVTRALQPELRTRAFILNTLLLEKATEDRLRHYPNWISSRNLGNEASDASVQALVDAVTGRYDIPTRYYRLKRKLLGLDQLHEWDRYAPLARDERQVGWHETRDMVLDSFNAFSPEMANIARRFFDERWIDAPTAPGKRGGAYSHPVATSVHPYVMLNFTGRRRDALVVAHELGHGVHQFLCQPQGPFNADTPLTLAETASVFGETMLFERMLAEEADPAGQLALISGRLEDEFATIFRQISMNRFEDRIHTLRREQGELSIDQIGTSWMETQRAMFADSVNLTDDYSTWWSYIGHFIDYPGYVYAYAYGNLLALAVYGRYREEGPAFVPRYIELLSAGGSDAPDVLARKVGIDLTDPGFWATGLESLDHLLSRAEKLAAEVHPPGAG